MTLLHNGQDCREARNKKLQVLSNQKQHCSISFMVIALKFCTLIYTHTPPKKKKIHRTLQILKLLSGRPLRYCILHHQMLALCQGGNKRCCRAEDLVFRVACQKMRQQRALLRLSHFTQHLSVLEKVVSDPSVTQVTQDPSPCHMSSGGKGTCVPLSAYTSQSALLLLLQVWGRNLKSRGRA